MALNLNIGGPQKSEYSCVEAESQLARGRVVIEVFDPERPGSGLLDVVGRSSMLESGVVNVHAAYAAIASRINSDRDLCSRAARASRAASSSVVRRSATTCAGSAPRPDRPRPRRLSASAKGRSRWRLWHSQSVFRSYRRACPGKLGHAAGWIPVRAPLGSGAVTRMSSSGLLAMCVPMLPRRTLIVGNHSPRSNCRLSALSIFQVNGACGWSRPQTLQLDFEDTRELPN